MEEGQEEGEAEGSSAIGDGEEATILFTPDIDGMRAHIFESLQLEGSEVGDLTVCKSSNLWCFTQAVILPAGNVASKGRQWMTCPAPLPLPAGR